MQLIYTIRPMVVACFPMKNNARRRHHDIGFILIAIIKFLNGILLLAVGIGALSLLNKDLVALATHWADVLQVSPENQLLQQLLEKLGLVRRSHLAWLSAITFVYSALLIAMGVGLWLEKRWGEYLTAIVTASFIPFEIYKVIQHTTVVAVSVLVINALSVAYIVWRLARGHATNR